MFIRSLSVAIVLLAISHAAASAGDVSDRRAKIADSAHARLEQQLSTEGQTRLIVTLKQDISVRRLLKRSARMSRIERDAVRSSIASAKDRLQSRLPRSGWRTARRLDGLPFIAMTVDRKTLDSLIVDDDVAHIEEDRLHRPSLLQTIPLINADLAWSEGASGTGQFVAVLDTGVDTDHAYFANKTVLEACFSSTYGPHSATTLCPNGQQSQIGGNAASPCSGMSGCDHGTHVAGIAVGNGAKSGVAKDADLIAVQVFSRFNDNTYCGGSAPCVLSYTSDQIAGLQHIYSLRDSYSIASVNLSLGGSPELDMRSCDLDNRSTKTVVDQLRDAGIATVAAAGNEGSSTGISAPACISSVISVGAVSDNDNPASYTNAASWLNLWAPGSSVQSSVPGSGAGATSEGSKSGTSMATPHVAGAFAALKSKAYGLGLTNVSVDNLLAALTLNGPLIADPLSGMTFPRIDLLEASYAIDGGTPLPLDLIVDSNLAGLTATTLREGGFQSISSTTAFGGHTYRGNTANVDRFRFSAPDEAGTFRVHAWWPQLTNASSQAQFDIQHNGGLTVITADQTTNAGQWNEIGVFDFSPGDWVEISDASGGLVSADAMRFERFDAIPISILSIAVPDGEVGAAYSHALSTEGGAPPYSFTLASGSLPAGVSLQSNGILAGTPSESGNFDFVVMVTDSILDSDTRAFTFSVLSAPNIAPQLSISAPADGSTVTNNVPVTLTASAIDAEDGNLSGAIGWTSSLDGVLGTGASVQASLSIGTHQISASVIDSDGATGSDQITLIVEDNQPPPTEAINFNDYTLSSYPAQDIAGGATIVDGGTTLQLNGNTWKRLPLPYVVTPQTIIEFDFKRSTVGEIHGIAFGNGADTPQPAHFFNLDGTQNWGNQNFRYTGNGNWVHFTIPVGQFYTGSFSNIVFVMDDDANAAADSYFSSVVIAE